MVDPPSVGARPLCAHFGVLRLAHSTKKAGFCRPLPEADARNRTGDRFITSCKRSVPGASGGQGGERVAAVVGDE
jgi:hypothetical protein